MAFDGPTFVGDEVIGVYDGVFVHTIRVCI